MDAQDQPPVRSAQEGHGSRGTGARGRSRNQRISAGIKQLAEDPWEAIDNYYKVGDLVTGKVSKLASFGAFVGLEHDIDGLVHISQVSEDRIDKIKNAPVGEEVSARVIKIDRADRRIGLSIKAANYSQEQLKEEEAVLDSLPGEISWPCSMRSTLSAARMPRAMRLPKPPRRLQPRHRSRRHLLKLPAEEEAPAAEEAPAEDGEASSEE